MRKSLVAVALAAMAVLTLAPVSGVALPPPGVNNVGIYTANDGTGDANMDTPAPGQFVVYLGLSGCSVPQGVHGWELRLVDPPGQFRVQTLLMGQAINAGSDPDFNVGIAVPLPNADLIVFAEITYFLTAIAEPSLVLFDLTTIQSIAGELAFAGGDNPGNLLPMEPSSGDLSMAVFGFNSGPLPHLDRPTIPTEETTWGEIKNMYR